MKSKNSISIVLVLALLIVTAIPLSVIPLASATTYTLAVTACTQYGAPCSVPLYIDGQCVGSTGNAYTVEAGTHTIYIQPFGQYFLGYAGYGSTNPIDVSVTSNTYMTGYFFV
jgi:hypothetical protein